MSSKIIEKIFTIKIFDVKMTFLLKKYFYQSKILIENIHFFDMSIHGKNPILENIHFFSTPIHRIFLLKLWIFVTSHLVPGNDFFSMLFDLVQLHLSSAKTYRFIFCFQISTISKNFWILCDILMIFIWKFSSKITMKMTILAFFSILMWYF